MSNQTTVLQFTNLLNELTDNVPDLYKKNLYFHTPDGNIYRIEATQIHETNFIIRLNDDMSKEFRNQIAKDVK